jgi:NAD(P)-dependent dehydrogenase (short-subunit alcohol dehydrogenase family)
VRSKMAAVNVLGTARMSRLAIRQFLKQDVDSKWGSRGRIINISSCAGHFGFPGEVAYSSTKASIDHMTHAGALEYANDYININCIAPGVVATGMTGQNFEG